MKRTLAILLALLLGLSLLAGCGKEPTETPDNDTGTAAPADETQDETPEETEAPGDGRLQTEGTVDAGFLTFELAGGWYLSIISAMGSYNLNIDADGIAKNASLLFEKREYSTPKEALDGMLRMFTTSVQKDDVVINGVKYLVLAFSADRDDDQRWLVTSMGPELKEDERGTILINLFACTQADAMPVLETVKIK
jgi:predicted small lipoprotein YifL